MAKKQKAVVEEKVEARKKAKAVEAPQKSSQYLEAMPKVHRLYSEDSPKAFCGCQVREHGPEYLVLAAGLATHGSPERWTSGVDLRLGSSYSQIERLS